MYENPYGPLYLLLLRDQLRKSSASFAINAAAFRSLSLPISAILLWPALNAALPSSQGSGNCTLMTRRLPPSLLFIRNVACPKVAEPAKKSRSKSLVVGSVATSINRRSKPVGFGKGNIRASPKSLIISFVPCWVKTSSMMEKGFPLTDVTGFVLKVLLGMHGPTVVRLHEFEIFVFKCL